MKGNRAGVPQPCGSVTLNSHNLLGFCLSIKGMGSKEAKPGGGHRLDKCKEVGGLGSWAEGLPFPQY